jgi:deoxyribodipyrimidine photolyase-related protein
MGRTVLVLGDQLNRSVGALAKADPGSDRVVMVESDAKLRQRPWHRQKLALVLSAMRHFAAELRDAGFAVTYGRAASLRDGLSGIDPDTLVVMAPSSWDLRQRLQAWGIEQVGNDAFIVGEAGFRAWAEGRDPLVLESFYRMVRRRHGWLLDGDEPIGGRWNFDEDNRERPPRGGVDAPHVYQPREDEIDAQVLADLDLLEDALGLELYGEPGPRRYAATRAEALRALRDFVDRRLDGFGPLEDAVVADAPYLWHSVLSPPMNLGLVHPAEICGRVDAHHREHGGPINSHEGFLRQVAGWREYVWGLYWWRMPAWREDNVLHQRGPVPSFYWDGDTRMHCLASTLRDLLDRGWTHHIPRLMLLGNYALLAGVDPQALTEWFHAMYVDAYEWVMVPNVIGMSQWADGGVMATKPYAASANYINRMTTYCGHCPYDQGARIGEDACPFNALYWDFMGRHRARLRGNRRMAPLLSTLDRFDPDQRRAIEARARRFRTDVHEDQ